MSGKSMSAVESNNNACNSLQMAAWEACLWAPGAPGLAERIAEGMNVNAVTENRHLPLAQAARCAGPAACRLLIEAGARVNAVDPNGITPLHQAIAVSQGETVELLLAYGASTSFIPDSPREDYLTPFQLCVSSGRLEEVERFVAMGEDLSQKSVQGQTLLELAATDLSMRQLLLSLGTQFALTDAVPGEASSAPARSTSPAPL
jgi:ankyrin repeat protein